MRSTGAHLHVVTAGPCAGKTSTLRELSARGYRTCPEGARVAIDQAVSEGKDMDEFRETEEFTQRVLDEDSRAELNAIRNSSMGEHVFLDRSLADNIAYAKLYGRNIPDRVHMICEQRYDTVFVLDQLEFETDYARTEDEEEARVVHQELINAYEYLGYDIIEVPVKPVSERADIIEERALDR